MFFIKDADANWIPCGPKQHGAVQITMQDLAAKGLGSKVLQVWAFSFPFCKILS